MTRAPLTRRKVLALAFPVILAQAATATTGIADTAVMGMFGDKFDLGAVAVSSVVMSFLYWGFGFLRMSTTGLTAQAAGADNRDEVRAVLQRALLTGGAIGLAILIHSPALSHIIFIPFGVTEETKDLALDYWHARIWGAPAVLMGYGITGWLLGTGRTGQLLAFQIVMNGTNAGLDVLFVAGFDWGPAGIGAGTAIAEWTAFLCGAALVRGQFRPASNLFDKARLMALLGANRDIMIRTLALLFCFFWFARAGTSLGTAVLAGNEVLLQFVTVSAFVLDGFAFVAEKEIGEAFGAKSRARLLRAMRLTTELALFSGLAFTLIYLFAGPAIIEAVIRDEEARNIALRFMPYCALIPLIGLASWQLDGFFLGATQGKAMRNAGIAACLLYVGTDLLLRAQFDATGLWLAWLLMYAYRALALGLYLPGLIRKTQAIA